MLTQSRWLHREGGDDGAAPELPQPLRAGGGGRGRHQGVQQ